MLCPKISHQTLLIGAKISKKFCKDFQISFIAVDSYAVPTHGIRRRQIYKTSRTSGHRIIATPGEGMAPGDAAGPHPESAQGPISLDGLVSVVGA
jgi:hypothetical protein